MSDRETEAALRAALEPTLAGGDELVMDDLGPAIYRLAPLPQMSAVACFDCRYTSLVPSIPRKPSLLWTCPQCHKTYELRPPALVWVEGSRVLGLPEARA